MISTETFPIFDIFHHEVSKLVYVARSPRKDDTDHCRLQIHTKQYHPSENPICEKVSIHLNLKTCHEDDTECL